MVFALSLEFLLAVLRNGSRIGRLLDCLLQPLACLPRTLSPFYAWGGLTFHTVAVSLSLIISKAPSGSIDRLAEKISRSRRL